MFNPDAVGRTRKNKSTFSVTDSSISAFVKAIDEPNVTSSPPTYGIIISLGPSQQLLVENGLDWSRVVHGDQKFEIHRPLVAGDEISCHSTIENYRSVAGNEIVTVRTDLFSGEELTQSQWTTLVVRG